MNLEQQLYSLNKKWVNYNGSKYFINSASITRHELILISTNKGSIHLTEDEFDIKDFNIINNNEDDVKKVLLNIQGNTFEEEIKELDKAIEDVSKGINIDEAISIKNKYKNIIDLSLNYG